MDTGRLFKWIIVIAVAAFAWKFVLPRIRESNSRAAPSSAAKTSGDDFCIRSAESASEAWGSGLRQFINPPYNLDSWSSFRSDVETKISSAESQCACAEESCTSVRDAMRDLRGLVGELDGAIRNGTAPPDDLVQRQAAIDDRINEAADLVRRGK